MDLSKQPTAREPGEQHHRNSGLFSDHYLNETLPRRTDWQELIPEAGAVLDELAGIFNDYTPSNNEAQTETDLIRPVLHILGHGRSYEVQPALSTPDGTKRPDYVFYKDAASLAANKNQTLNEELLSGKSFAIGDAKYWDRALDLPLKGKKSGDPFTNKNPSYQISFYMRHAGTDWGILTNGRLWRLYHRDTAHKLDRFYEVDLQELVESGDAEKFLYFYAFFRRAAFDDGPLGVSTILQASDDYARGVGDSLKGQVYEALRHLAQGFLDYPANGLDSEPDTLKAIYDNSLIALYRLLFVLYAEARELLPVRGSEDYRASYSLHRIKHDVAEGSRLLPDSDILWPRLVRLFKIIDRGSPPLSVATFNGGLFDPARHPFLEEYTVGDAHLQTAVDMLSRVNGEFVDYRDLAERHLGTIYEGLLEFHLEALDEPEEAERTEPGWTVALENDSGERKATGSYYTPDFVVKYIVEETVGPVIRAAIEDADTDEEKVEAVLALDVLDPAMGSGHFLVEVTEYIARFLVELDVSPEEVPDTAEAEPDAELAYWKRRVVQSCVYGVDMNPLAVDLAKLSLWLSTVARDRPLSFLDHHLRSGNSLVGARLTDLQPGNTGGKKRRKTAKAVDESQLSMLADDAFRQSMSLAVGNMWVIEENPAASVEDVKEQEQLYERLREDLTRRYARLADLVTATRFGVEVDPTLWQPLADYATSKNVATLPQFQRWLDAAQEISAGQRFFHWELEFPEVYFDRHGKPLGEEAGFDAVVGNPPYVRQEALGDVKAYFKEAYAETYHGVADLYVYFYQQGLRQLRRGGRMGYIVTNKWLRAGYGEPLRGYFAEEDALVEIVDFGHAPIFPDADVFPCIVVLQKRASEKNNEADGEVRVAAVPREELGGMDLGRTVEAHAHTVPRERFGKEAWSLESSAVDDLMAKIRRNGVPLAEFAGVKPAYGIKTGLNEAFLIGTETKDRLVREDPASAEVIKPYLRGQDIKRWSPDWQDLWMIVLKSSGDHAWPWSNAGDDAEEVFRQTYPSLHSHMKSFEAKLHKRQDHGRYWWELRSCAYYEIFEQPKIIHTDITWRPQFAFTEEPTYLVNTAYMWPTTDLWVLAVVNAPLLWAYMWRNATHGKDEALRLIYSFTEKLPIAPPTDEARTEAERAVGRLVEITRAEQESRRDALDWLRVEYGIQKSGQKLSDFAALTGDEFVEEVRKRRPKGAGRLSPAGLKELRSGYADLATPVREGRAEAAKLEQRLSNLVNEAYGLTPEEVELLWSTAPPRMPRF
ncbi:MAG: N-6 DNA methylase [Rubrobacteraceae bacterium]